MIVLTLTLAMQSFTVPNFNTLAIAPMAAVAGTAAAVIGTVNTAGSALIGAFIDRAYDGTVNPLAVGFVAVGIVALAVAMFTERGRLDLRGSERAWQESPEGTLPPAVE